MSSLDLTKLLPSRYRDKTLDSLIKNLYNRHLSKPNTVPLFGFVGAQADLRPGEIQISDKSIERQINQLTPLIYTEHASEKEVFSWFDLIQRLVTLGVDYKTISQWLKSKSYNFVPPINLDKFCNFHEYYWVGKWLNKNDTYTYSELGLTVPDTYKAKFASWENEAIDPEYYVIARGDIQEDGSMISTQPDFNDWSDWSLSNLWVHKNDAIAFLETNGKNIGFGDLIQARRPIIEYSAEVQINQYIDASNAPCDSSAVGAEKYDQRKTRKNQLPLFDLYLRDGNHSKLISPIFYYKEGPEFAVDSVIGRRLAVDSNADFTFVHSLVNEADKSLYFYRLYEKNVDESTMFTHQTIWKEGPEVAPRYSKHDLSGTLINSDKFKNFKNYYWVGADLEDLPTYNRVGLPEYYVIERGGESAWSTHNYWVHASTIARSALNRYIQAVRPIIEYNNHLETELLVQKTHINEIPTFKMWREINDQPGIFVRIENALDPGASPDPTSFINDAYLTGHIFARVKDLDSSIQDTITSNSDVLKLTFSYNDELYCQNLYSGSYAAASNGIEYGLRSRVVKQTGVGTGHLAIGSVIPGVGFPDVVEVIKQSAPNTWQIKSQVYGLGDVVDSGSEIVVNGSEVTISEGDVLFEEGDTFVIETTGFVFELQNLYVLLDSKYRTFDSQSAIITEIRNNVIVDADPTKYDGAWEVPAQLEWNPHNETRPEVKQGDLYFHLLSIIEAQPTLIGSSSGDNNLRNMPEIDLGLGGTIKQYDGDLSLLISMLMQEGITYHSLIDFARTSYQGLSSAIRNFVEEEVPNMLSEGIFSPPNDGDVIDPIVIERFKSYFSGSDTSTLKIEALKGVVAPFYDSTSALHNLVLTLPYLGLVPLSQPAKVYDDELNMNMLRHHDGHLSTLLPFPVDLAKKTVTRVFARSNGLSSAGEVTGATPPTGAYRGQFWFKTSTNQLFVYDVISDTGEQPATARHGAFSLNRLDASLWQYNGVWNLLGEGEAVQHLPWKEVKLDLILQNIELAIETELFNHCPPLQQRLDFSLLEEDPKWDALMEKELLKFGVKYDNIDVYAPVYVAENAFTWNYFGSTVPEVGGNFASWQQVYKALYGTARPDLYPWIVVGNTEQGLLTDLKNDGRIPGSVTAWSTALWPACANFIRSQFPAEKLSVDAATGDLLPPYSTNSDSLFSVPPSSARQSFKFNDLGPIELFWTRTADYLYSKQKVYFKLDPLQYVRETWGTKSVVIDGYTLDAYRGRKIAPSDIILHGAPLDDLSQLSWIDVSVLSAPQFDLTYEVKFVSRMDDVFKITLPGSTPVFIKSQGGYGDVIALPSVYLDEIVSIQFNSGIQGFFWGDTYNVKVFSDGRVETTLVPQQYFRAEGFNQIYMQYNRMFGKDSQISINTSLLNNWDVKLGYRFSGLVNTDTLSVEVSDTPVDNSAFSVYLKENKVHKSAWLNALRVQLVKRGSTTNVDGYNVPSQGTKTSPGEDWVFRVDNYFPARSEISWYEYDRDGDSDKFVALDGTKSNFQWTRYRDKTVIRSASAPFLVTGIQNFITFLHGFSDKLEADGWRFNDQNDPILDPTTNRQVGFQLLLEQFIVQQFENVDAGSSFVFNPFFRKVWFETTHGVVSALNEVLGFENETVCTVLDEHQKRINDKQMRVFRQDEITQFVFDKPVYTLHVLVSEYEHVLMFNNYSVDTLLIYDSFLGQRADRMFIQGEKQAEFTGRLDFGGHFLLGHQMKKNVESSLFNLGNLYNTNSTDVADEVRDRARALLGFKKKQYFKDRGTTDVSEFRFWQGMIANKGTNFSVDAFINAKSYNDAQLDEYWAYKLATYGDSRKNNQHEIVINPEMMAGEHAHYMFLEADDDLRDTSGYDSNDLDSIFFDDISLRERGITATTKVVSPYDEKVWFSYSDLNSFKYFELEMMASMTFIPENVDDLTLVTDSNNRPILAAVFEIFDHDREELYHEQGDYVPGTNPPEFSESKFSRVGQSTIQIISPDLIGRNLEVRAFGPAFRRYSPHMIVDFVNKTTLKNDVIWWDPSRGYHHPLVSSNISTDAVKDPANYNQTLLNYKNSNRDSNRVWGEQQVGTVWWNSEFMAWKPYSDDIIFSDPIDRLRRWGATSDAAKIEVYEWVKSSVPPEAMATGESLTGEPAISRHLERARTWWQRPVAWRFSDNPEMTPRKFKIEQNSELKIDQIGSSGILISKYENFNDLNASEGTKIAAKYDNSNVIFGTAVVVGSPIVVAGTSDGYNDSVTFNHNEFTQNAVLVDSNAISFRANCIGKYKITSDGEIVTCTFSRDGLSQTIPLHELPVEGKDSYVFDTLGVTIEFLPSAEILDLPEIEQMDSVGTLLNNVEFFLRSAVNVKIRIPFIDNGVTHTELRLTGPGIETIGWIGWDDPTVNPIKGQPTPRNKFEPIAGEWVQVGTYLSEVASDIKLRTTDQWSWFDGSSFAPYKSSWTNWKEIKEVRRETRFSMNVASYSAGIVQLTEDLKFDLPLSSLVGKVQVFLREQKLKDTQFDIVDHGDGSCSVLPRETLKRGDLIKVVIEIKVPTADELKFDPTVQDNDPFKMTQYKLDYPHVKLDRRDESGFLSSSDYFFWVKNKTSPAAPGKLSIKAITALIRDHDGVYAVPHFLKPTNQLDGRPNRYSMLTIKGMGSYVGMSEQFKFVMRDAPNLRDTDKNLEMKNTHEEWLLLRPRQTTKIPKQLWDKVVDSMVGTDLLNHIVPSKSRSLYDLKHKSSVEYGVGPDQIMADPAIVIATVRNTIINTQVDKYIDDVLVPDFIGFEGFDIAKLDDYLSSSVNIRKLMADLWRNAKSSQINEIFFNVLDDALANSTEIEGIFKSSFVSLSDVRTLQIV